MFLSSFASVASKVAILVLVADLYWGEPKAWWIYLLIFLGAVALNYLAEIAFRDAFAERPDAPPKRTGPPK